MEKKYVTISLLRYVQPIMLFLGALPDNFVSFKRRIYIIYRYIIQGTILLFLLSFYFYLPHLRGPIDKVFQSVSVLSTYSIMYIKGLVCLTKNMSDLIVDMASNEANIKKNCDKGISDIYRVVVKRSKRVQIFYIVLTYSTCITFIIPSIKYVSWDETKFNSTMNGETLLPFVMWLPFDTNKHYLIALIIQTFSGLLATNYYCFMQCILVILPLNITLRLKILGSNLRKIKSLRKLSCVDDKDTDLFNVKEMFICCIKEHIHLIRNCSLLNETIKRLMLLEFLLTSAQISLALIQLTTTNKTNVILYALLYLFQVLVQLLILYWHADEIREQSVAICDALYELHWYEYNKTINTNIQIMMARCQKPLSLTIGPFGEMSLAMAVKIVRAAYTYATFMQQTYGDK